MNKPTLDMRRPSPVQNCACPFRAAMMNANLHQIYTGKFCFDLQVSRKVQIYMPSSLMKLYRSMFVGAMQICMLLGLCKHCVHRSAVLGKSNIADLYRNA